MAQVRLTKSELKFQQVRLEQLKRYLPTLQLKKAMLQIEVNTALQELAKVKEVYAQMKKGAEKFAHLLTTLTLDEFYENLKIEEVKVDHENIAGVEIPLFKKVVFAPSSYSLFVTPLWWDNDLSEIKELIIQKEKMGISQQKVVILQKELRDVSIRVNLFEKILIPRTEGNIKKIKVFLGDQQLSAVSQAKVAKEKIIKKRELSEEVTV
jgi:V/A-type H+-transporting ATPase subunit D